MDSADLIVATLEEIREVGAEIRDLLRDRPPERLYPRCATCARPVDRDHKDACELADGKGWVCSEACWEEFAAKCDRPPERGDAALDESLAREKRLLEILDRQLGLLCQEQDMEFGECSCRHCVKDRADIEASRAALAAEPGGDHE